MEHQETETRLRKEGEHTRVSALRWADIQSKSGARQTPMAAAAQRLLSPLFTPPNVDQFPEAPPAAQSLTPPPS